MKRRHCFILSLGGITARRRRIRRRYIDASEGVDLNVMEDEEDCTKGDGLLNVGSYRIQITGIDPSRGSVPKDVLTELPKFRPSDAWNLRRDVVVVTEWDQVPRFVRHIRQDLNEVEGYLLGRDARTGRSVHVLGFDTETRPTFTKRTQGRVAVVQLSVPMGKTYVFQLCNICRSRDSRNKSATLPGCLLKLLSDHNILKVGVGVRSDVISIRSRCPTFDDRQSFVDLEPCLRKKWPSLSRTGLRNVVGTLFRRKLSKTQQMSNWERRKLSDAQIRYAAFDAIVGWRIWGAIVGTVRFEPCPENEILGPGERGPWSCALCEKTFPSKGAYSAHLQSKRHQKRCKKERSAGRSCTPTTPKAEKIDVAMFTSTAAPDNDEDLSDHANARWACEICTMVFNSEEQRAGHILGKRHRKNLAAKAADSNSFPTAKKRREK